MKRSVDEPGKLATRAATVCRAAFDVMDLGLFDNNRNDVKAVNDRGQLAGVFFSENTGRIEAFQEEGGNRIALGTLGGSFSIARDINNRGEIVGGSLTQGDESFHGFLYRQHRLYDLNEFLHPYGGWELIQAFAINNRGEIVGVGSHNGRDHIVLLRPKS